MVVKYFTRYYRDNLNYITDYTQAVNNLSEDLIQAKLKELVDQGNIMEVVMMPGSKPSLIPLQIKIKQQKFGLYQIVFVILRHDFGKNNLKR